MVTSRLQPAFLGDMIHTKNQIGKVQLHENKKNKKLHNKRKCDQFTTFSIVLIPLNYISIYEHSVGEKSTHLDSWRLEDKT